MASLSCGNRCLSPCMQALMFCCKDLFIILNYACACGYAHGSAGAGGGKKSVSDPLELELGGCELP